MSTHPTHTQHTAVTAVATYVFAVCPRRRAPVLTGVTGHAEALGEVRALPVGPLAALVQPVPAASFDPGTLRERLSDPATLAAHARAHHEVVAAVARAAPTAPLPMATLFLSEERTRQAIVRDAPRLLAALARVDGREEWGVKVAATAAGPRESEPTAESTAEPAAVSGRAYLDQVRARQQARQERQQSVHDAAERVDAALRPIAVAARRLRPHDPAATAAGRGRQVLNAAYLVDTCRVPELTARVSALRHEPGIGGRVTVEITGPWPPYSFAAGSGWDGQG